MSPPLLLLLLLACASPALLTDSECVIELTCSECVPEHMPLVTSHRAVAGVLRMPAGDELRLACPRGRFLTYPHHAALAVLCEAGRLRVRHDGVLRHLLHLGCQDDVFEDVPHQVEFCAPPLQGRAYRVQEAHGARHLATLCFDQDRGVASYARAGNAPDGALPLPPHEESSAPRSLLANFNQMFDSATRRAADRLYSDDDRLHRRLREILKHDRFSFAEQTLTSVSLLAPAYFDDQNVRVADFASNRVAAWRSVAAGNLRHLQRDVARLLVAARPHRHLEVYAGTHGVLALRTGGDRTEVFLEAERFPVPRYVWTVVQEAGSRRAVAVVVLNDPFVSVSEVREAVFCESLCGRVSWLQELRRHRHYESAVYGLTFCCAVHEAARRMPEVPAGALAAVPAGDAGLLTDLL
ncbi:uncharacterized protein LOC106718946 [Papilio machaon]|uniref:uncharacterized protein LOC106718946 n=1 Tax=Papilio machaon TaxID=76193 RepID=UPI001E6648E9|nr:uncharacterized protein LOC106718946 [Papilio machaon]